MEFENNGQWGNVVELSMDELALVGGGSFWSAVKSAFNWVTNHTDDISKGVSTVGKIIDAGKKVISFLGSIF